MIGWMLFGTLLILVVSFMFEMEAGFGRAFGYSSYGLPFSISIPVLLLCWALFLAQRFHVITFWFQK